MVAGRPRMALWWCLLFGLGLVLVLATKIAFVGWGIGIRAIDFTGISGHSMRATAVMPLVLHLILQKTPPMVRATGVLLGLLFGVLIGISRLILNTHSMSEAVAGCLLGALISLGFIYISNRAPKPLLHRWLIASSLIIVFSTRYAEPIPTQPWIRDVALYLSGHDRPYIRATWRMVPCVSDTPMDGEPSKLFDPF